MFEGYFNNDEADNARLSDGWYWTGDLAYRDEAGFVYFAGRNDDWLRVDSENFAAAPVERILERHTDIVAAAVYPVPDAEERRSGHGGSRAARRRHRRRILRGTRGIPLRTGRPRHQVVAAIREDRRRPAPHRDGKDNEEPR